MNTKQPPKIICYLKSSNSRFVVDSKAPACPSFSLFKADTWGGLISKCCCAQAVAFRSLQRELHLLQALHPGPPQFHHANSSNQA
mmetsp:Transcript_78193/g.153000  ORF Transcript_78193/g.153000 Transcript_78193/m.153000 type:complete len:85 (-) Transcript_78193:1791-2045(-)